MTIKEHLETQAHGMIERARGRDFTEEETRFLHLLNHMLMYEHLAQIYRDRVEALAKEEALLNLKERTEEFMHA